MYSRRILVEQIRIQPGSLNPRATDRKGKTKREKNTHFFPLFEGWQRQCSNTHNKLRCSFPRAVAWLLGQSRNGQDQRDWKSTANNILYGLPLRDISAVARGCVLETFNVCVCMCVSVYVYLFWHFQNFKSDSVIRLKFILCYQDRESLGTEAWAGLAQHIYDIMMKRHNIP